MSSTALQAIGSLITDALYLIWKPGRLGDVPEDYPPQSSAGPESLGRRATRGIGILIILKMTFIESIPHKEILRFCQRWQVRELALFGSALRADFKPERDADVLISFQAAANWGLFDHVQMRLHLEAIFKRKVDLVTLRTLEQTQNDLLRERILKTTKPVFDRNEEVYTGGSGPEITYSRCA
jgi:hypothetical protein